LDRETEAWRGFRQIFPHSGSITTVAFVFVGPDTHSVYSVILLYMRYVVKFLKMNISMGKERWNRMGFE
jgi:hypothetical protein